MAFLKYPSIKDRYETTYNFIKVNVPNNSRILDLGVKNELSDFLAAKGYNIKNTEGEDLDIDFDLKARYGEYDVVTGFEILEHLVSPFPLLKNIPANKLIVTIPLNLWFARAFKNPRDTLGWHFHEYEDWQFDWLLEKAGWKIIERRKWVSPSMRLGFRTVLRWFTPRYYGVYAIRSD